MSSSANTTSTRRLSRADWNQKRNREILAFVVGALMFQRSILGEDPTVGVDIEAVFDAIRLQNGMILRSRR